MPFSHIPRSSRLIATELALLLALAALWGGSYPLIRVAVASIPPLTLIAARTWIAGLLLLAWIIARGIAIPRDLATWRRMLIQSLLNSVLPFTLIAWAEQFVDAGLATMLNSVSPVWTFIAAWGLTGEERCTPRRALGVALGLVGVALVIGPTSLSDLAGHFLPEVAILAATVCYAGAALYARSFRARSPAIPAAGSMLLGAVVLTPASLLVDRPWTLAPSAEAVGALAGLAVFSTALAFVIYFRHVASIGSVATTAQAYLRVPIGVGLGIVFLGESLSPTAWAGGVCIVSGVAAMTVSAGVTGRPPGSAIAAPPSLEVSMRRLVLLLAILVGWFSLTKGERHKLSRIGRDSLARSDAES